MEDVSDTQAVQRSASTDCRKLKRPLVHLETFLGDTDNDLAPLKFQLMSTRPNGRSKGMARQLLKVINDDGDRLSAEQQTANALQRARPARPQAASS
ncbi:hypothetical protein Cob_v002119 [Colletotrichum orbiculare MAFF 240422]|uniref:Uncharacterized protein n=1 Tax=Colletotrichum orbiculare (strain 104-T / ATCC 96160 / CBS 514.97 / LARS 414 / MAFF 240422) TaxID=1213857 RepID=A0A484G510_COLOR|nr:hypothetical protein Cob_v002119 [Colletotrichum orbiculare MAFF 240422]